VRIDGYQFGKITIGGKAYTSDLLIMPSGVKTDWWRVKGHELCVADLEPVWKAEPDVLIIGTGAYGVMKVLPEADSLMRQRCTEVHVLPTHEACRRFNELAQQQGRRVVAALHLTC